MLGLKASKLLLDVHQRDVNRIGGILLRPLVEDLALHLVVDRWLEEVAWHAAITVVEQLLELFVGTTISDAERANACLFTFLPTSRQSGEKATKGVDVVREHGQESPGGRG